MRHTKHFSLYTKKLENERRKMKNLKWKRRRQEKSTRHYTRSSFSFMYILLIFILLWRIQMENEMKFFGEKSILHKLRPVYLNFHDFLGILNEKISFWWKVCKNRLTMWVRKFLQNNFPVIKHFLVQIWNRIQGKKLKFLWQKIF